jgi:hypothetical protein
MLVRLFATGFLAVLLLPSGASAQDPRCWYPSKAEGGARIYSHNCGVLEPNGPDGPYLLQEIVGDIYFDEDSLACIAGWDDNSFLLHRDGQWASVSLTAGSCPRFEEGLSVVELDGREVYVDNRLRVALDPGFDSLGYFREGFAVVCNGPFVYEESGEHTRRTGGQCGLIDRSGQLVVGLLPSSEGRSVFEDYRNSHNECRPPPIEDAESALCHAKRHARNSNPRNDWADQSIELVGDVWFVTYANPSGVAFTIYLGAERANLINIVKGQYREAFEQVVLPNVLRRQE